MFAKGLGHLAERKRLVILEAALHRGSIETECAALASRMRSARNSLKAWKLGLSAGGALAGMAAMRSRSRLANWLPVAFTAWRWVRNLV